ncbi:uncharacterized protein LOC117808869 [Xyrichtys novacula]|uniref:Uncharacterized protein LOC117808869 n=1 Tax=Xyrichtys novacula TaxID=13765 RepID=A0AAV1EIK9_XYRNO|nr:uncharacterized protein LOC117808869 [Xyrichtys novacula]
MISALLLSAALVTGFIATSSEDSTGWNFTVVFPENIAFYYPNRPYNRVYITSLTNETKIYIKTHVVDTSKTLSAGQTEDFLYNERLELRRSNYSNVTLRITSNQRVTIHAISLKSTSIQTVLVIPNHKLGTEYFIPPVPPIQGTTVNVTERQHFRLIIVNTNQMNEVTVKAKHPQKLSLHPDQVAQVFITDDTYQSVKADHPITVIFGHTCAIYFNCTCSLLYTMLSPASQTPLKFYIPTVVVKGAETKTSLLLSNKTTTEVKMFDLGLPVVETAGTAILFHAGLLLKLIPVTDFAACYFINFLPNVDNFAVILVHKNHIDGVHMGSSPLKTTDWERLTGTDYVSTKVKLTPDKRLIWHSLTIMAVYFQGRRNQSRFGNPAAVLSKSPDYRGCISSPENLTIGSDAMSWPESVQYCRKQKMELISLSNSDHQRQIYDKIQQAMNPSPQEMWIGMRRSSLNTEWSWLNKNLVNDTNWAENEPGAVEEGHCVVMSANSTGKGFVWSDKECCEKAYPVCYIPPILISF